MLAKIITPTHGSCLQFMATFLLGFMFCYAWLTLPAYTSLADTPIDSLSLISQNNASLDQNVARENKNIQQPSESVGSDDHNAISHKAFPDENSMAKILREKVRVIGFVLTGPDTHQSKTIHVKETWAKRWKDPCKLLYMSSQKDESLPTVVLPVEEGRDWLWRKTRESLRYIYENYKGQYDWVLKADDDTFVILENLRYLLAAYDPNEAFHIGCPFKYDGLKDSLFMFGGAGYVLSRKAVEMFVKEGLKKCNPESDKEEDIELTRCLENMGVKKGEGRDGFKNERFFGQSPSEQIDTQNWADWIKFFQYYEDSREKQPSDTAVTFHRVTPDQMYVLDYFIYRLKAFGVTNTALETNVIPGGANISTILEEHFQNTSIFKFFS